jgi:hypothetical protein
MAFDSICGGSAGLSRFAAHLLRLSNGFAVDRARIDGAVTRTADAGLLTGVPTEFVAALLAAPISIVAAGPPAKSFALVRALIETGFALQEEVFLAGATDSGTEELSDAVGWPVGTVQRLLGWNALRMHFAYGEDRPLPRAIIVIADADRLSPNAADQLARASRTGSRLVFMFDGTAAEGSGLLPEIEQSASLRLVLPRSINRLP